MLSDLSELKSTDQVWFCLIKVGNMVESHLTLDPTREPDLHPGYQPRIVDGPELAVLTAEYGAPQSSTHFSC